MQLYACCQALCGDGTQQRISRLDAPRVPELSQGAFVTCWVLVGSWPLAVWMKASGVAWNFGPGHQVSAVCVAVRASERS